MGDRTDFVHLLADFLKAKPSEDALRSYAEKFPDRFMQGMAIAGRLAGFTEKLEVKHSGTLAAFVEEISGLSDAELLKKARETGLRPIEPLNAAAKNLAYRGE